MSRGGLAVRKRVDWGWVVSGVALLGMVLAAFVSVEILGAGDLVEAERRVLSAILLIIAGLTVLAVARGLVG